MKKIIFLFIVSTAYLNNSYSQNNYNWITPNKTYLKLYVIDDGIYRIDKQDFINAGITKNIDPRTVKVLYKGNQIPIYFQGENDGVFDNNDYFDFYGKRNYGGPTPHLNGNSNQTVYTVNEYYNLYSDTSIYWIDWGGSNGARMQRSSFVSAVNHPDNYFFKRVHFEQDKFYVLGETINPNSDFRYFSNEIVAGEGWFWRDLSTEQSLSDTVTINDLSVAAALCSLKVFIYPNSFTDSVQNEHRVEIKINNTIFDTLTTNNFRRLDTTVTFPSSLLNNNTLNSIILRYIPLGSQYFEPHIHIDFFTLSYPRDIASRNNHLSPNFSGTDTASKKINVTNFNSSNPVNIYDIKNNIKIDTFTNSGGILTFSGKSNSAFEIINNNITKKPFKIISRSVRDLVSSTNGADYLVVYNKIFESQAEQLRAHRESIDNFRSVKSEIEDIYDIFNYGMESPVALRNFVKYAYENWSQPRVKYLCLFGRASLDPKKNSEFSQYYQNFVPTYGNPASDGYFANFNIGTFTYYHQISVGRIPAYTVTEAQNAVNKITAYDFNQPDKWWKKYLAITGGPDRAQQILFQGKSESLINNYIKNPPITMPVSRIYRNDSTGYITYNYKDSIKREFDRGALIVNFIGHAASQDWEIGLENPNTLNNGNKQPLVLSFTCFTGKCCEPYFRSFGENFFLIPNKCAIGFVGSTGWSFSGSGDYFNDSMLKSFARDSLRRIGELLSFASKSLSRDSLFFSMRNTINCYTLLGDPATKLLMPRKPEFDIKQNDYALSNPFPALGEIIKLTIFPKNLGTYVDSLKIKYQLKKNGTDYQRTDTIIRSFGYLDTLNHFFSVDTIGNYTMTVVLDPDRRYSQGFTNNDSITFALTLRNLSYVPIKPLDNSVLNVASFKFTGLNPNVDATQNNVRIILQIDTAKNFSSPAAQTFNNNNITGVTSSFNVNLPVQNLNTIYFIRTNAIINNDSSGWSDIQRVIYNPNISDNDNNLTDSTYTIYVMKPGQYNETDLINVNYTQAGFSLNTFNGTLFVRSHGSTAQEASYFLINNYSYYSDAGANTGMNVARVRKFNGLIEGIRNFRMNSPQSSDSVLNFLNTFDTTDYLMAYIASWVPNSDSLRADAKAKFKEFGSIMIDSVTSFSNFFTWSFIGYLGASSNETCEGFSRSYVPQTCQMSPSFQNDFGSISHTFGPADKWKNFSWEQVIAPNSLISFDVYGIDRDNISTLLYTGLTSNSITSLDTVDYYRYPNLNLVANLSIDTLTGFESPVFQALNFKYVPPAEIVPDNYSVTGSDSVVQEGDSISFKINYYNVGYIDAPAIVNKWYVKRQGIETVLKYDSILSPLHIDSMRTSEVRFSTTGMRDPKIAKDTIDLYFETNLIGERNEIFSFNNTAITQFIVEGDTLNPLMEITYDGVRVQNGDYVQSNPDIVLNFLDDSRMVISDTSSIKVFNYDFSNSTYSYIPYYINGVQNPIINITFPDNRFLQATVTYNPSLQAGEHRFRYVASDITGNFADTVINDVIVDNNLRIYDMANYPNPMKTETNFMFMLSGGNAPSSCKVKIFTVAGRVIKEINVPANIGYNNIPWDGKDNDGDYIANGAYLYKFIIEGDSKIETSIQKLAVLR